MKQKHILTKVRYLNLISGLAFDNLGKFDDAIKMYNQALKINPNDANAYVNKGKSFRFNSRSCILQFRKI